MAKSVIINEIQYPNVPEIHVPLSTGSGEAVFYDTSGATADATKVLAGETVYANGLVTGSMPNNGAVTATITTKAQSVAIGEGYHNGSGSVSISATEQAKIVSSAILSGHTILGVSGASANVNTADATATASQIVSGATAYVNGSKITGALTAVNVSQDSTTKVLTIS